jgi:hypothetical protein
MKNIYLLILLLLAFSPESYSQYEFFSEKREEIKKQQMAFISQELQLTEKEKKDFLPLYLELDKKREDLHLQKRKIVQNFKLNSLNMTNEQLTELSDKIIDFDNQTALLGKEYHEKFKKVLPPLKIILLYQAETEFKKLVLRQAHGKQN